MRISALVDRRIRDEDGRVLGRVTEVRAVEGSGTLRVTELLLGPAGLRHRLLGRGGPTHAVDLGRVRPGRDGGLVAERAALRTLG